MSLIDNIMEAWQEHPVLISLLLLAVFVVLVIVFGLVNQGTEAYMDWIGNLTK